MSAPDQSPPRACSEHFPRIGSYGFISDCETGALLASDGSIEWLCLPRFDSPSIFGALLDRSAGALRFSPDERVPVARRYEPGTNVIETTWATETGWLIVRDALLINAETSHSGRRRLRGAADAGPLGALPGGGCRDRARLRHPSRLRARHHRVGSRPRARGGRRRGRRDPAAAAGGHGARAPRRAALGNPPARHRRERVLRADLVRRRQPAGTCRRGRPSDLRDRTGVAALARAGQVPRPSLARRAAALGPDPEGPDVRADRRHGRGADHVAAGDARRRAQLGLPLHLDPRRHLHALGPARARARRRGDRLHVASSRASASTTRTCRSCTGSAARRS